LANGGWRESRPQERAWKPRKGGMPPSREQDKAAEGRAKRLVSLSDGRTALGSIVLRVFPKTRRIRAALRWSEGGKSPERYLGEVHYDTRATNLAEGWRLARAAGLLADVASPRTASQPSNVRTRVTTRGEQNSDTRPERTLRSLLHKRGLRYRVDARPVAERGRRADILFPNERLAVLVDGCSLDSCPEHCRRHAGTVMSQEVVLAANHGLDGEVGEIWAEVGWDVIRVCEREDMCAVAERIQAAVCAAREQRSPTGR